MLEEYQHIQSDRLHLPLNDMVLHQLGFEGEEVFVDVKHGSAIVWKERNMNFEGKQKDIRLTSYATGHLIVRSHEGVLFSGKVPCIGAFLDLLSWII